MKKQISMLGLSVAALMLMTACSNPVEAKGGTEPVVAPQEYKTDPAIVAMVPAEVKAKGVLTVGVNADVPPIKFVNDDGEVTGLAPQLVDAAAQVMGLKTEMQLTSFDSLIPGLESNRFDLIASISDFQERQTKTDFIDYLYAGNAILASADFEKDSATPAELCGTSIAYIKGTQQQGLLESAAAACTEAGQPTITASGYQDASACILAIKSGQENAAWLDSPTVLYNASNDPELFKSIYNSANPGLYGIAVNKENTGLRDALAAALKSLVADGSYQTMVEAYGLQDSALPELPFNQGGPIAG